MVSDPISSVLYSTAGRNLIDVLEAEPDDTAAQRRICSPHTDLIALSIVKQGSFPSRRRVFCTVHTVSVDFGLLLCVIIDIKGHIFHGQYLFREMSACKKTKQKVSFCSGGACPTL